MEDLWCLSSWVFMRFWRWRWGRWDVLEDQECLRRFIGKLKKIYISYCLSACLSIVVWFVLYQSPTHLTEQECLVLNEEPMWLCRLVFPWSNLTYERFSHKEPSDADKSKGDISSKTALISTPLLRFWCLGIRHLIKSSLLT